MMNTFVKSARDNRAGNMKHWNLLLTAFACMLGLHASVHAQVSSFDCTKAATPTERTICSTPALGAKDIRMATYYQILQNVSPAVSGMAYREFRGGIHDAQTAWMKRQRDVCKEDVACLEQAYDRRIKALHDTLMKNVGITYGRMCDGD